MQACDKEMLEWAMFANQYHLERLQEKVVLCIAGRFRELNALPEFDGLSQGLLRKLTRVLAESNHILFVSPGHMGRRNVQRCLSDSS